MYVYSVITLYYSVIKVKNKEIILDKKAIKAVYKYNLIFKLNKQILKNYTARNIRRNFL